MEDLLLPGIRGTLVSGAYASRHLAGGFGHASSPGTAARAQRELAAWWRRDGARLGPASSLRCLIDAGAAPVLDVLGLRLSPAAIHPGAATAFMAATSQALAIPLVVTTWGANLDALYSRAVIHGTAARATWALGFNGTSLRLWDATRGWMRAFIEFDLETIAAHAGACSVFWALLRADALAADTRLAAGESDRHGLGVRTSLRRGVRESLALLADGLAGRPPRHAARTRRMPAAHEEALTLIYRVLFLLFAESRGLVPAWHPLYRRSYSMEALRARAETPGRHTGLWQTLQAMSRLAHSGCRAGDLIVTPFNGRLFAPGRAPAAESARLDDALLARALVAITTSPGRHGRERITFSDLGVEQLGAVYESLLDDGPSDARDGSSAPAAHASVSRARAPGPRRKSSGTFYTPREMTDYVVRQALEPLVAGASPETILGLKVVDPAMGSGAFLVAACHYLALAYERALVRDRGILEGDITDGDRAGFRRLVAQRCLYGVDLNPMAVQVARLSLWLATLAADKPLTFLDHHLAAGNSLIGASLDDIAGRPPGTAGRGRRARDLPLFPADEAGPALLRVLPLRRQLALVPDDTAAAVRDKERLLARIRGPAGDLDTWRRMANLWCAAWFRDARDDPAPSAGEFAETIAAVRGQITSLPPARLARRVAAADRAATSSRFFHWTLEFPEVFYEDDGTPRLSAGFDAIVTNPPWEMMRADTGAIEQRAATRPALAGFVRFTRESGLYPDSIDGHANLYQLFVERCLRLTRAGGRIGLIAPWGLASDHGSRSLRQHLLQRCDTDTIVAFDNAAGVFPIHRGVRFLLLSTSPGAPTQAVQCHLGLRDPIVLDTLPGATMDEGPGATPDAQPAAVRLTPAFLARVSGPELAFPYVRDARDLRLLERISHEHPPLGLVNGWGLSFGRELNVTDDRHLMTGTGDGWPVIEGKHVAPFSVTVPERPRRVARALLPAAVLDAASRERLAYRDVAASTNQLTLIAAIVPPGTVTVHTLFCLKARVPDRLQAYLCGMLNSWVANYVARLWVTTHVSAGIVSRIPVPRLAENPDLLARIAREARALEERRRGWDERYARLQAMAAEAYGLDRDDLSHVLESFPLVDGALKQRCLSLAALPRTGAGRRRALP